MRTASFLLSVILLLGASDSQSPVGLRLEEIAILKFDKEVEYDFQKDDDRNYKLIFVAFPPEFSVPINLYAYPQSITVVVRKDGKDFTTLSAELAEPMAEFEGQGRYRCKSLTIKVPVEEDAERWQKYVEGKYKFVSFNSLYKYSPDQYYSHWLIKIGEFGPDALVPVDKIDLVLKEKVSDKEPVKIFLAVDADDFGGILYSARSATIYAFSQEEYSRLQKDLEETKQKRDDMKQPKRVVPNK